MMSVFDGVLDWRAIEQLDALVVKGDQHACGNLVGEPMPERVQLGFGEADADS